MQVRTELCNILLSKSGLVNHAAKSAVEMVTYVCVCMCIAIAHVYACTSGQLLL